MILEEFDETKTSTFDPYEVRNVIPDFPSVGITCFSHKIIDKYISVYDSEIITYLNDSNGKIPVYKINYKGHDLVLYMSKVGASGSVGEYEEMMAMGLKKLVMFGSCGVLDSRIEDLSIIIPTSAVRDEGTSYHYKKASREVSVNKKHISEFESILKKNNISYTLGKVWTTDAPYRETRNKVLKRKEEGCICVDMECSAMHSVCEFRDGDLFQFFYAADNLDSSKWDRRSLGDDSKLTEKEKTIYLALEMAIRM